MYEHKGPGEVPRPRAHSGATAPPPASPIAPAGQKQVHDEHAASARPRPHRLKPKNQIASTVTGAISPSASRTTLITVRAATSSSRAQRAHHQVADVARPHLLEERRRKAKLAAEQDVPQQHGADQRAGRDGGTAGRVLRHRGVRHVGLDEPPGEHLDGRPVDEVERRAARTSAGDRGSATPSRRRAPRRSRPAGSPA